MSRRLLVALTCLAQLGLVGIAVAPSLSARVLGDEVRLEVAPVDPIDPFRGAYVDLSYPALAQESPLTGTVYAPLVRAGEVWTVTTPVAERPVDGRFLRCDADGWRLRCGIESLFVPQEEALRLERELADGGVATIRVDGRGNAAVVAVDPR